MENKIETRDQKQINKFLNIGLVGGLIALTSLELSQDTNNIVTILSGITAFGGIFGAAYKAASHLDLSNGRTLNDEITNIKKETIAIAHKLNDLTDKTTDSILAFRDRITKPKEESKKLTPN